MHQQALGETMQALKMVWTRWPKKGRMQAGADADSTIFDPAPVKDNSTIKAAGLPSTGIPYVIVNGTIVVKESKVLKGVYPGPPIIAKIKK